MENWRVQRGPAGAGWVRLEMTFEEAWPAPETAEVMSRLVDVLEAMKDTSGWAALCRFQSDWVHIRAPRRLEDQVHNAMLAACSGDEQPAKRLVDQLEMELAYLRAQHQLKKNLRPALRQWAKGIIELPPV